MFPKQVSNCVCNAEGILSIGSSPDLDILPYDINKIVEKTCQEFMPFEALTKNLKKDQVLEKIELSILDATRPIESYKRL